MISYKTKVPNSLIIKLSRYNMDLTASELVNRVSHDALFNVKEYGIGTAGGNEKPTGGAPYWQGKIWMKGHRRGYLSDSHHIKYIDNYHMQIVSSADFADNLMEGVSSNWFTSDGFPIVFPRNYYHKRAVDKLYSEGRIHTIWRNALKGRIL